MGIFNRGLERFIAYISKDTLTLDKFITSVSQDKPNHVEVSTDFNEGGEVTYVCEHFGVFTE